MRKILIIIGTYLPGCKAGGPVQSMKNLTDRLGDEYEFYVLTADRDLNEQTPYENVVTTGWVPVGKAKVHYVPNAAFTREEVLAAAQDKDLIYLCGCFNDYARVTLLLKKQGKIKAKVVIASMGLFSPGAFRIKYPKKKAYMEILKALGMFRQAEWSVTDAAEEADVKRIVGPRAVCHFAHDIPQTMDRLPEPVPKTEEGLRVVFLSRISRKKNLDYAIDVLRGVRGKVLFDFYGPREDASYFAECMEKAGELPANVTCTYKGGVTFDQVISTLSKYQVFLFPTRGENYGHVIYEALAGGCFPVISDQAPWQQLEDRGIGRVIPLDRPGEYTEVLQKLTEMSDEKIRAIQQRAAAYAKEYADHLDYSGYREIFGQ